MSHEVVRTDIFEEEYDGILSYLAYDLAAPAAARRLISDVDDAIRLLAEFPEIHAASPMSKFSHNVLRKHLVGKHLIVYTISEDAVVLLHIFHQLQDYERLLEQNPLSF